MLPRLYSPTPLTPGSVIVLDPVGARHLREGLRLRLGEALLLFDGRGGEFAANLTAIDRQQVRVRVGEHYPVRRESALDITLAQGISRSERMDYTIQKAVELGVSRLVPLATERSTVRLDAERARKRAEHWAGIVRHAAEQSGRTEVPPIAEVVDLAGYIEQERAPLRLLLDPSAGVSLTRVTLGAEISLAIGPEGGFSPAERALLLAAGYQGASLGPRVLRTETAALVALSILQSRGGDLA
ncbi:MAG: 16S rRNA (uracil(1498)-N(3))-methyltransferase [Gammaproteobacteria bacterium]|nr:16S rRNA (uracil(1498)-N(3))-methyltransferase [Gammaproteobacteria bacterium]